MGNGILYVYYMYTCTSIRRLHIPYIDPQRHINEYYTSKNTKTAVFGIYINTNYYMTTTGCIQYMLVLYNSSV